MSRVRVAPEFLSLAHRLADAAGEAIRPYYRAPGTIEQKADHSPVTAADRAAERVMRDLIAAHYPEHGIVGEEFGAERPDARLVWCLDPIDGTKAFITGRPLFGTLVALLQDGVPVLGVIDQCISGERWVGAEGEASTWNGRTIRVRPCARLADAVLSVTSPVMFEDADDRAAFQRVEAAVHLPVYGGDCYAYGLLAMGFADVIVEAGLDVYDFSALVPVIEGAGGIVTDWRGRPLSHESDGRVIAAGDQRVHAQTLELLALTGD